jgi:hypothetical protein
LGRVPLERRTMGWNVGVSDRQPWLAFICPGKVRQGETTSERRHAQEEGDHAVGRLVGQGCRQGRHRPRKVRSEWSTEGIETRLTGPALMSGLFRYEEEYLGAGPVREGSPSGQLAGLTLTREVGGAHCRGGERGRSKPSSSRHGTRLVLDALDPRDRATCLSVLDPLEGRQGSSP